MISKKESQKQHVLDKSIYTDNHKLLTWKYLVPHIILILIY